MASIATYSVTGFRGRLHHAVRRIARLPPRPGVNGEAWVYDGWETEPQQIITTVAVANYATALTTQTNYRNTQDGTTKTIVDPHGTSWSVKVQKVEVEISASLSGTTYVVLCTWLVQVEAAAP